MNLAQTVLEVLVTGLINLTLDKCYKKINGFFTGEQGPNICCLRKESLNECVQKIISTIRQMPEFETCLLIYENWTKQELTLNVNTVIRILLAADISLTLSTPLKSSVSHISIAGVIATLTYLLQNLAQLWKNKFFFKNIFLSGVGCFHTVSNGLHDHQYHLYSSQERT